MTAREKAGEVLAAHRIEGVGPGGECWCACGMGDEGHGTLWNPESHRAHVADALAEAGLLTDEPHDGCDRHACRIAAEARAVKAERERNEAREALARLEALADEMQDDDPRLSFWSNHIRAALRGDDA